MNLKGIFALMIVMLMILSAITVIAEDDNETDALECVEACCLVI